MTKYYTDVIMGQYLQEENEELGAVKKKSRKQRIADWYDPEIWKEHETRKDFAPPGSSPTREKRYRKKWLQEQLDTETIMTYNKYASQFESYDDFASSDFGWDVFDFRPGGEEGEFQSQKKYLNTYYKEEDMHNEDGKYIGRKTWVEDREGNIIRSRIPGESTETFLEWDPDFIVEKSTRSAGGDKDATLGKYVKKVAE